MFKIKYTGFTLIELLLIIAIIGILSSVVLVNIMDAKKDARDASAIASITSTADAFHVCLLKNNDNIDDQLIKNMTHAGWMPYGCQAGYYLYQNTPDGINFTQPEDSICGGTANWPTLPVGWEYFWILGCSGQHYYVSAINRSDSKIIACSFAPRSGVWALATTEHKCIRVKTDWSTPW